MRRSDLWSELGHEPAQNERGEHEGGENLEAEAEPSARVVALQEGENEGDEGGEDKEREEMTGGHDLRPTATS